MSRRYDYDLLRVLSMLGVVYLHVCSGALRTIGIRDVWEVSIFFSGLFTPAVPLFFMMSGSLLLSDDRTENLHFLFRRRLPKLLLPLLAWSALFTLYSLLRHNPELAADSVRNLLHTPVNVGYWFLYALIPMYLIAPLLKKMTDHMTPAHWHYMMALWAVLTLGLNTLAIFLPKDIASSFTLHPSMNLNFVAGYLGYFLLGAYLERLEKTPPRWLLWAVFGIMLAVLTLGTRQASLANNTTYTDKFVSYLNLFVAAFAASIFLLFKSYFRGKQPKTRVVPFLSSLSFGVYLSHPAAILLLENLWPYPFGTIGPATIPQQVLFYAVILGFCLVSCALAASVPVASYLITGQTYAAAKKSGSLISLFPPQSKENP